MNAKTGSRGHRFGAAAGVLVVVLCSDWFCPSAVAAETNRRLPRLLVSPVPTAPADPNELASARSRSRTTESAPVLPTAPEINWRNGETLTGELKGVDAQHVIWKTPLFTEEMRVRRSAVRQLTFPGGTSAQEDPFRLVLADGTHLTGELSAIDGQSVSFNSTRFGAIAVRRDQVVAVERVRGEGIVKAGPAEILAGTVISTGRLAKPPACMATGGRPVLLEFNGGVTQGVDLPEKCLLELRLRIEAEPAFSLSLAHDGNAITLETWSDELVLLHKERFVSAGKASTDKDGLMHLRVGLDRPAGRCVLFGADGKPVVALLGLHTSVRTENAVSRFPDFGGLGPFIGPVVEEVKKTLSSLQPAARTKWLLTLVNRGSGFVVERYSIADWQGGPPPALVPDDAASVETAAEIIAGEPIALIGDALTVRSADGALRELALGALRAIRWPRPMTGERDPALTDVWYCDGTLLRGTLTEVSEGKARIETAFASAPIVASLERCRAILMPDPGKATIPETTDDSAPAKLDVLAAGGVTLHGSIKFTGKPLPDFQPTGGDAPLTPTPTETLTLTRSLPSDRDYEPAPALLHLKRNESLPVTVLGIDSSRIEFASSATESAAIPTSEVHAVQFNLPPAARKGGFDAPGWRPLGRSSAAPELGTSLFLQAGTGIGHPNILHGNDFSFSFGKESQMTSLRLRLFCQGTDASSDSMNFLLGHFGSQIHCGLERGQNGQMESSRAIAVGSDGGLVLVDFRFAGDQVEMLVNRVSALRTATKGRIGRKTGSGLIIETASLWGNVMGAAKLADFSMHSSLNLVSPPPFSEDAKREALLLPRSRRDLPPRQILIGRNGDLLRGEIGTMAGDTIAFRVGLEHFKVPIDRIAAAVWVEQPDKTIEDNVKNKTTPLEASAQTSDRDRKENSAIPPAPAPIPDLPPETRQWLDLSNGGRLELTVESWTAQGVAGRHPSLGRCLIPPDLVYRLALKAPAPAGALTALAGWKFQNTVDPNPPGLEESDLSPLVGKPAADFTLTMLDGNEFSLSKAKGKVIVLDFWATWCGPCIRSLPALIATMATFPPDKVVFVSVNQGESKEQVRRFLQTRGLEMPVAFDSDMRVGGKYGAEAIPYTVVIDPAGTVCHVSMGETRDGDKKIATAVTKAAAL